jgi:hypothetical protein
MILSYKDLFERSKRRTRIKAEITTDHPTSSYGQPVIVLEDGGALDLTSWVAMDYQVKRASKREMAVLQKMGLL